MSSSNIASTEIIATLFLPLPGDRPCAVRENATRWLGRFPRNNRQEIAPNSYFLMISRYLAVQKPGLVRAAFIRLEAPKSSQTMAYARYCAHCDFWLILGMASIASAWTDGVVIRSTGWPGSIVVASRLPESRSRTQGCASNVFRTANPLSDLRSF